MPIELIICDNDGCLIPETPGSLPPDHFARMASYNRQAAAPGSTLPPLTVATGRPVPFVEMLLRLIHATTYPAICEHGALTYSLADNTARRAPELTPERRAVINDLRLELNRDHPEWITEAGKEGMVSIYVPEGGEAVEARADQLRGMIEQRGWPMKVGRTVTYVNVTFSMIDKGVTLRRMLSDLEIDPALTLAIGDTAGDLPLREVCGSFACPANAIAELRAVADYVSPFETMDGVMDILTHFTGNLARE